MAATRRPALRGLAAMALAMALVRADAVSSVRLLRPHTSRPGPPAARAMHRLRGRLGAGGARMRAGPAEGTRPASWLRARSADEVEEGRVDESASKSPNTTREYRGVTDRSKPKRKVLVYVGFTGTNYKGFVHQGDGPEVPTVERALFEGLHAWGAVLDENYAGGLSKLGWSRASRTDKGVHAVGAAFSCKLLLPDEYLELAPTVPWGPWTNPLSAGRPRTATLAGGSASAPVSAVRAEELERLNALLPPDIRVMSIQRVRGSFKSYRACSGRRYQYLLPAYALGPGGVAELNDVLSAYCGTHTFHNFASGLRAKPDKAAAHHAEAAARGVELEWPLALHPNKPPEQTFRTILRCELDPTPVLLPDGCAYHAVLVHGVSFVYHQIRFMLGGALAVVHGQLPRDVFDIALSSPFRVACAPLAPGEGLALALCEFYNAKRKTEEAPLTAAALERMEAWSRGPLVQHVHALFHASAAGEQPAFKSWFEEVLLGGGFHEPGHTPERWDALRADFARWSAMMDARKAERPAGRRPNSPLGSGVRLLPNGVYTQVGVEFKLLPGPELERLMARLIRGVESGELPPNRSVEYYLALLRREEAGGAATGLPRAAPATNAADAYEQ